MSAQQSTATERPTATVVNEEDALRAYNWKWSDTAFGRADHIQTCTRTSHRNCGGTR